MSEFDDLIEEYVGEATSLDDIRLTVRRLYDYDFFEYPTKVWQGSGRLFTTDANAWLGTMANGVDYHKAPNVTDGRDGSSGTYTFSLQLIDTPGLPAKEVYEALKAEQWRVAKRSLRIYLAVFVEGEGLRPQTPVSFFKELTMISVKFSEKIEQNSAGTLVRKYIASVVCKDGNSGRSETPNGTYSDTVQKERARQLGVTTDRGCEYVAILSNRTYTVQ